MTEDEKLWAYGALGLLIAWGVRGWWRERHPKAPGAVDAGDVAFGLLAFAELVLGIAVAVTAKTMWGEIEGILLFGLGFLTCVVVGMLSRALRVLHTIDARLERAEQRLGGAPKEGG